jgi:hypothetical protein
LRPCPLILTPLRRIGSDTIAAARLLRPLRAVSALDGVKPRSHDDLAQFSRLNHEGYGQLAQLMRRQG